MAEYASAAELVAAIRALRAAGATRLEAYTPYEVAEVQAALPPARASRLPWAVLIAGLAGGAAAYALEWWTTVVDYPLDVGGRPDHSWPAFLPIAFEMAILCAGLVAFVGALAIGGMPRLWHPVFEIDGFERATHDRFWLAVDDPPAALPATELREQGALRVVVL